jgi:hypothetical protein
MARRMFKNATAAIAGAACAGVALAQPPVSSPGMGLTIKDLRRVEQVRGDTGGLGKSLAQGPAIMAVPNDFAGVYQIPEDADTPYAGWYARFSGALIAVFPRGEYTPGPNGLMPVAAANTRFFLGSIPLNRVGKRAAPKARTDHAPGNERVDNRYTGNEPLTPMAPDAPPPLTVETASDAAGVTAAMEKMWADPVYRANRLRELMERAAR